MQQAVNNESRILAAESTFRELVLAAEIVKGGDLTEAECNEAADTVAKKYNLKHRWDNGVEFYAPN